MLKVVTPITLVILVLASCAGTAFAGSKDPQDADWHLDNQSARVFFLRSPFAHGYMHGYEEGFHTGDLDLQLGRSFRPVKTHSTFKKVHGYRNWYGDHDTFKQGYQKGYAVGYTDSYSGRGFRAMQLVRMAESEHLPARESSSNRQFDQAFIGGYNDGRYAGLRDGRLGRDGAALDSISCRKVETPVPTAQTDFNCGAYQRGFRLGYSDGYTNQHNTGQVFARK